MEDAAADEMSIETCNGSESKETENCNADGNPVDDVVVASIGPHSSSSSLESQEMKKYVYPLARELST